MPFPAMNFAAPCVPHHTSSTKSCQISPNFGVSVKVKCKFCKKYVDRSEAVKVGLSHYCSIEHYFSNGKTSHSDKKKKLAGPSKKTRDAVLLADNYMCRLCSARYNLHIHHIKYRSEGGAHDQSNLITLCLKCHELVHSDKKMYQPLCKGIVANRDFGSKK